MSTKTAPQADDSRVNKPRTRQRSYKPAPVLELPDIEENAPERKRILNVLAQRRYSQYHSARQRVMRPNSLVLWMPAYT